MHFGTPLISAFRREVRSLVASHFKDIFEARAQQDKSVAVVLPSCLVKLICAYTWPAIEGNLDLPRVMNNGISELEFQPRRLGPGGVIASVDDADGDDLPYLPRNSR